MKISDDVLQMILLVLQMAMIMAVFMAVAIGAPELGEILKPLLAMLVPK